MNISLHNILQVACPQQADLYVKEYYDVLKHDLYSETGLMVESNFIAKHFDGNLSWYESFKSSIYMNAKRLYHKKPNELSLEELKEVMR